MTSTERKPSNSESNFNIARSYRGLDEKSSSDVVHKAKETEKETEKETIQMYLPPRRRGK